MKKITVLVMIVIVCNFVSLARAEDIAIEKTAPEEIKIGSILIVNIVVHNFRDVYVNVKLRETVTNADPIDPPELIIPKIPSDIKVVIPPFYEWNFVLGPNSTKTIVYKIKPLNPGYYMLGPTRAYTDFGSFYSNSLTVVVACNMNDICEPDEGENYFTCSEDCPSGSADGVCDLEKDGVCDPDCTRESDPDCKEKPKLPLMLILGGLVVMVIIVAIIFMRKRKSTPSSGDLYQE